ncbi:MAG: cobalamin biosynthesis protein [Alphaproteobacteria bacterium]|nr:cobalamin biosynthesis protein [Alphaproteobacteria bacterium]
MEEFLLQWHEQIMAPERVPVVLLAILLSVIFGMITGPLAGNANPFLWVLYDTVFGMFGERLDKRRRTHVDLLFRGFLLCAFVIVVSAYIGKTLETLAASEPLWGLTQGLILSFLISSGSIWFILLRLYFAMAQKKVGQGAYYAVARSTRVNLAVNDDYGISRAALSFAAVSFDKGLVAPALWFILGGFPAICIYGGLSMLVWRYGKKGFASGFGQIALALEKLMGFMPSVLAALYLTLAALFTPTARLHRGVAAFWGHKNRAPYEQGGLPLSSLAWSLHVGLGGAVQDLSGSALHCAWVGPEGATARITHGHIRRGLYINVIAHILFVASLLALYMWAGVLTGP